MFESDETEFQYYNNWQEQEPQKNGNTKRKREVDLVRDDTPSFEIRNENFSLPDFEKFLLDGVNYENTVEGTEIISLLGDVQLIKPFTSNFIDCDDDTIEFRNPTIYERMTEFLAFPVVKIPPLEIHSLDTLALIFDYYTDETAKLLQLRLVCKKFSEVYELHKKYKIYITKNVEIDIEQFSKLQFLQELRLHFSKCTPELAESISKVIRKSHCLRVLDIQDDDTKPEKSRYKFAELIKSISALGEKFKSGNPTQLKVLRLPSSILGRKETKLLATALKSNTGLEIIDVDLSNMTSKTNAKAFFGKIKALKQVKSLIIRGLRPKNLYFESILENFFNENKNKNEYEDDDDEEEEKGFNFSSLTNLQFENCNFLLCPYFYIDFLSKTTNLKSLTIKNCDLFTLNGIELYRLIANLRKLEFLDLSENALPSCSIYQFFMLIPSYSTLKKINLFDNKCYANVSYCIDTLMVKIPSLHQVDCSLYTVEGVNSKFIHDESKKKMIIGDQWFVHNKVVYTQE